MKSIRMVLTVLTVLMSLVALSSVAASAAEFTISVPAFKKIENKQVFKGFGCEGGNISPEVSWENAPEGTKSFALTVYDPDAPTGSGWWHWVAYNIPATTKLIVEGAGTADGKKLPKGTAQGTTDFGTKGYGGPCPPAGDKPHHYIVTLTALKTAKIEVPATATAAMIGFNIGANALGKATMTGTYGR